MKRSDLNSGNKPTSGKTPKAKYRRYSLAVKRTLDILGATIFFVFFGWLFLLIWITVLVTTGGPAIYRHVRIGKGGQEFSCLKFRSMAVNSEQLLKDLLAEDALARAEWNRSFKLRNDPRITKFGRFIRKKSLDELPQFWNVLKGEMSLVGPRPVVKLELVNYYGPFAGTYESVRPGITGPWQVGGRSDLSYTERVALDVYYIHNWTVLGDMKFILSTAAVFIRHRGSY